MSVVNRVLQRMPRPLYTLLVKYQEQVKFLMVGGTCFVATVAINYGLKLTILHQKPVTALTIAIILTTIASYILNREWSFRTRGGRERRHEAALFFLFSALGVAVNDIPMLISRYVLELQTPMVSRMGQEVADFVSGIILGTLLATVFRLWAFRRFVFPKADARSAPQRLAPVPDLANEDVA